MYKLTLYRIIYLMIKNAFTKTLRTNNVAQAKRAAYGCVSNVEVV